MNDSQRQELITAACQARQHAYANYSGFHEGKTCLAGSYRSDAVRNRNRAFATNRPSRQLTIVKAGLFWPTSDQPSFALLRASDHRLVWVDVELSETP